MSDKFSYLLNGLNKMLKAKSVLLIVVCGLILYSNSFFVPWYGDDFANIVENPAIGDLGYWLTRFFGLRWITGVTFALNYQVHGLELWGYHLVNLLIHLIASLTVYALLQRIFCTQRWLPLFGALIFLAHPIQTQAVNYIVQRSASLAGMFVFLGLLCWVLAVEKSRDKPVAEIRPDRFWYLLSLLFAALAVLSKANAAVFVILLFLFDFCFINRDVDYNWRQRLYYFLPYCIVPLLVAFKLFFSGAFVEMIPLLAQAGADEKLVTLAPKVLFFEYAQGAGGALVGNFAPDNLQLRYLATEMIVLWEYVRLLLLPIGLKLDYSYPLVPGLFYWKSIFAFVAWLAVGFCAFIFRRNRIWIFSLGWFLISLAVESTLIPLDPLFEHRLYLPMFGFVVFFLGLWQRLKNDKYLVGGLISIVLILAVMTYQRNELWASPTAFWQDNVEKTPDSYRPWATLGHELVKSARYAEALVPLRRALTMSSPVKNEIYADIGLVYIKSGRLAEAREALQKSLAIRDDVSEVHSNFGTVLIDLGDLQAGIRHLERAVELNPLSESGLSNLGGGYFRMGNYKKAARIYSKMIKTFPDSAQPVFGLGLVYAQLKQIDQALDYLQQAFQREPQNIQYGYYYALIALQNGQEYRITKVVDYLKVYAPQYYNMLKPYLRLR